MAECDHLGRKLWRWLITPPPPAPLWKRAAWALWLTPPLMLFPFVLPVLEPASLPGLLASFWDLYLLFFGVPFALGALCWTLGSRADRA